MIQSVCDRCSSYVVGCRSLLSHCRANTKSRICTVYSRDFIEVGDLMEAEERVPYRCFSPPPRNFFPLSLSPPILLKLSPFFYLYVCCFLPLSFFPTIHTHTHPHTGYQSPASSSFFLVTQASITSKSVVSVASFSTSSLYYSAYLFYSPCSFVWLPLFSLSPFVSRSLYFLYHTLLI